MRFENFFRNINVLNLLLIGALTGVGMYYISPVFSAGAKVILPGAKNARINSYEQLPQPEPLSIAEYTSVAESNLFHPERKIPEEKKAEQELPKPEFVLYGTLITDEVGLAYIEDLKAPRNTPGRGKRQTALKQGTMLSGFVLSEVQPEKVVMMRGEERMVVWINDPSHRKARTETSASEEAPRKQPSNTSVRPSSRTVRQSPLAPSPAYPDGRSRRSLDVRSAPRL